MSTAVPLCLVQSQLGTQSRNIQITPKLCSATLLSPQPDILYFPKCNAGRVHIISVCISGDPARLATTLPPPPGRSVLGKRAERNSGGRKAARELGGLRPRSKGVGGGCRGGISGAFCARGGRLPVKRWPHPTCFPFCGCARVSVPARILFERKHVPLGIVSTFSRPVKELQLLK